MPFRVVYADIRWIELRVCRKDEVTSMDEWGSGYESLEGDGLEEVDTWSCEEGKDFLDMPIDEMDTSYNEIGSNGPFNNYDGDLYESEESVAYIPESIEVASGDESLEGNAVEMFSEMEADDETHESTEFDEMAPEGAGLDEVEFPDMPIEETETIEVAEEIPEIEDWETTELNPESQENNNPETVEGTYDWANSEFQDIADVSADVAEIPELNEVNGWIGEINPNFDEFDLDSPYCNNCGSCAWAVEQRLDGATDCVATAENIGYDEEMEAVTGKTMEYMPPDKIRDELLAQGPGAHTIIGIDRNEGPGHWFNAYTPDGKTLYAIDGQNGTIQRWPPDYGDVAQWGMAR